VAEFEVDAFLADSVVVADGKLYVQGAGWNRILAGSFPVAHDRVGIGLIFHATPPTSGRHRFELRLEDADGNELALGDAPSGEKVHRLSGEFTVRVTVDDEHLVPLAINLNGLVFQQPGAYRFVASVDGEDLKSLRFAVQPRAEQTPTVSGGGGYL
jgi:hypothetical protein